MPSALPQNLLLHGTPGPPPERIPLRAGPWSLAFEAGDLRCITLGDREVIRRIYAAVRDRNWGTVPGRISDLQLASDDSAFRLSYTSEHRQAEIHFVWRAQITGAADSTIRFTFDGEAKTTFQRNRIGFCVLHPIEECAGARCHARYADGAEWDGTFPRIIAAVQPVTGLHELAGLAHEIVPGVWAELEFEGDIFEMEDQRNWIDASFKTFCTPLRLPFPALIQAGTRVRQEVRLRLVKPPSRLFTGRTSHPSNTGNESPTTTPQATRLKASEPRSLHLPLKAGPTAVEIRCASTAHQLPKLGLSASSHHGLPDTQTPSRLRALRLAHLRVDVRPGDPATSADLTERFSEAQMLGVPIELAIHLDDAQDQPLADAYLATLAGQLRVAGSAPARILIFGLGVPHCTSGEAFRLARQHLAAFGAPIGGGSNADLYELNLSRPPAEVDFICWSMNPQVHAFDNASIAETPEGAAHQITSAREYFPSKPLVVSPITLKPRFNAVATGPASPVPPGELPPPVDPRQLSLFGAAWTLAMIKALAASGAASATFYETTGWRGVMETATGSPLPEKFPSLPGSVFPLYHVLADVGDFAGGEVIPTQSSPSRAVASLFLRAGQRRRLLLANWSPDPQSVTLHGFEGLAQIRVLAPDNALHAMTEPESFRSEWAMLRGSTVALPPCGLVTLDATAR